MKRRVQGAKNLVQSVERGAGVTCRSLCVSWDRRGGRPSPIQTPCMPETTCRQGSSTCHLAGPAQTSHAHHVPPPRSPPIDSPAPQGINHTKDNHSPGTSEGPQLKPGGRIILPPPLSLSPCRTFSHLGFPHFPLSPKCIPASHESGHHHVRVEPRQEALHAFRPLIPRQTQRILYCAPEPKSPRPGIRSLCLKFFFPCLALCLHFIHTGELR
jgi:hypothetical protein